MTNDTIELLRNKFRTERDREVAESINDLKSSGKTALMKDKNNEKVIDWLISLEELKEKLGIK